MLTLYFAPRTRSFRPRWLLEEMGVPYELKVLDFAKQDHRKPEYLQIHPQGLVPALQDGQTTVLESSAICMHLADKFLEKGFAPPPGSKERGLYYQWIAYGLTTIEPVAGTYFLHTVKLPADKRDTRQAEQAAPRVRESFVPVEQALLGREYLIGDHLTVADILMATLFNWAHSMKLTDDLPALQSYSERMKARPAFQKAAKVP